VTQFTDNNTVLALTLYAAFTATRCIIFMCTTVRSYVAKNATSSKFHVDDPGGNFSAYDNVKEKKHQQSRLTISAWHYVKKLAAKTIDTTVKMHGQLITAPLYMTVNSSHNFRGFLGVMS